MEGLDTKGVLDRVVSETIGEQDSVSFRLVNESPILPGVKAFLFARTLELSAREQGARKAEGPVAEAILRTLALGHRFDRPAYLGLVTEATGFLAGYLVRPREEMLRWITEGKDEATVAAIERKLTVIHDYRYLRILISAWLGRRRVNTVTRAELKSALAAIDDKVVERHSEEELGLLARPLFVFARWGGMQEIPLSTIHEFYLEKKLDAFWKTIQDRLGPGVQSVGLTAFLGAINSPAAPVSTRVMPSAREVPPANVTEIAQAPQTEVVPESSQAMPGPGAPNIPDLRSMIPADQKARFVNSVFGRDADYFDAVIGTLNGIPTWKEAALFLSQFYQTNALDPFADEVVEFTDTIHHRYDSVTRR